MGWATQYIAQLQRGETVRFRPRGNSMRGKIDPGQLCTVEPVDPATLQVGDVTVHRALGDFEPLGEIARSREPPAADQLDDVKESVGAAHGA